MFILAQQVLKTSPAKEKFMKSSRRLGNSVKRHFNDRAGKVVYFHFMCAIVRAGMFLQTDKTDFQLNSGVKMNETCFGLAK